jgi:hypothetical protein
MYPGKEPNIFHISIPKKTEHDNDSENEIRGMVVEQVQLC